MRVLVFSGTSGKVKGGGLVGCAQKCISMAYRMG